MPDAASHGITTIMPVFLRQPDGAAVSRLERAIESVLSQDCGSPVPLELLIVDDGSEPAAGQLIAAHPGIRVLRLSRNRGLSYALNAGLTQARYDMIARLDADDYWRPGKLKKQLSMFAADPDLTLVGSSMRMVHPGKPELDRDELRGGDWKFVFELAEGIGCPFPHGSILARRCVFETLGGYPQDARFEHAEDFALWARWIRFFKVAICDEVFLEYTVSSSQISTRFVDEQRLAASSSSSALKVLREGRAGIPVAVESLASALGLDLMATSKALFTAWRYYSHILTDPELLPMVSTLLPDRAVHVRGDLPTLLADRFFSLSKTPGNYPQARIVHSQLDLR